MKESVLFFREISNRLTPIYSVAFVLNIHCMSRSLKQSYRQIATTTHFPVLSVHLQSMDKSLDRSMT
jgi:hypothetical protein